MPHGHRAVPASCTAARSSRWSAACLRAGIALAAGALLRTSWSLLYQEVREWLCAWPALTLAGQRHPRVARVVASEPYDYARGRGIARSSPAARLLMLSAHVPVLDETVLRLRTVGISRAVLGAVVATPPSLSLALLGEAVASRQPQGALPRYRDFCSLLRHAASWEQASASCGQDDAPILLMWGDRDWAIPRERTHERDLLGGVRVQVMTVEQRGHFLPLDRPDALIERIRAFALDPAL